MLGRAAGEGGKALLGGRDLLPRPAEVLLQRGSLLPQRGDLRVAVLQTSPQFLGLCPESTGLPLCRLCSLPRQGQLLLERGGLAAGLRLRLLGPLPCPAGLLARLLGPFPVLVRLLRAGLEGADFLLLSFYLPLLSRAPPSQLLEFRLRARCVRFLDASCFICLLKILLVLTELLVKLLDCFLPQRSQEFHLALKSATCVY
mmetsp:Transcript_29408/g.70053  ORF Transcript_29408/g.70053 Transcript_29408/m.70053 type:complete len:201 (-) Transcript_29408:8-610(-)